MHSHPSRPSQSVGTRAAILDTFRPKLSERTIANLRNTYENPPDTYSDDEDEDEYYEDEDDEDADAEFDIALIDESSYLTELVTAKPPAASPAGNPEP